MSHQRSRYRQAAQQYRRFSQWSSVRFDAIAGARAPSLAVPGLNEAPVLDLMCSHFVLTLAAKQGAQVQRAARPQRPAVAGRPPPGLAGAGAGSACANSSAAAARTTSSGAATSSCRRAQFLDRHGVWRGPYEEGTLFFYLDEYAKDQPKDLLSVLAVTGDWLTHALKKQSTLVEKNIDALAGLLQLNKAERALLLYGTLARYQRDLRSLLVEFKVNNAPEAYAAIAEVAGVNATEVGEALRAGSRLERIGLVENLISEHNITDLADLMKVSEKLPPVLMREYRDQNELMAVFTRPSAKSALALDDFAFVETTRRCSAPCCATRWRARKPGVNVLLYGPPGTGKTELAKVVAQAAGLELFEVEYADRDGNSLSGRDRYRSLQIAQVFLKGSAQAALLFDEVEDVFPPISSEAAQLMARAEQVPAATSGSVSGKAWVNQILESNAVPTLWVTNRIEQIDPAFRRRFAYHLELKSPPPGAREAAGAQDAGGRGGVGCLRRQADRAQGPDAGADPHRGALRRPGAEPATAHRRPDRAAAAQRRPGAGQPRPGRRRAPQRHHLRPGHAQRRDRASRCRASSQALQGARPRHAVLLRPARAPARPRWPSTSPRPRTSPC